MSAERFGLDTNVLIYLVDGRDPARQARAREVVGRAIRTGRCVLSVQSLGEFFVVAVRKGLAAPALAQQVVDDLTTTFTIASPTAADARIAVTAAVAGRFAYWDALLLATLERAGCTTVLSEDIGDGGMLGGSPCATRSRATACRQRSTVSCPDWSLPASCRHCTPLVQGRSRRMMSPGPNGPTCPASACAIGT